jgi:hypothetical protein
MFKKKLQNTMVLSQKRKKMQRPGQSICTVNTIKYQLIPTWLTNVLQALSLVVTLFSEATCRALQLRVGLK